MAFTLFINVSAKTETFHSGVKTFTYSTIVQCRYRGTATFTDNIYKSGSGYMEITERILGNPSITTMNIDNKYTYVNLTGNINWPNNYYNPVTATVYCY